MVRFEFRLNLMMLMLRRLDLQASDKRCLELERQNLDEAAEHKKKLSMCVIK